MYLKLSRWLYWILGYQFSVVQVPFISIMHHRQRVALTQLAIILYLKFLLVLFVMKEEDLSITVRSIRNVTYKYCALSTEVPLLFSLCLKLRMCHPICSRVGVFPRYCTCKWSHFSEERRTKHTEIDWPCCIMYLFVTDISEHFKAYSWCSVSARIWISQTVSSPAFVSYLDRFSKPVSPVLLSYSMFTCSWKRHVKR